MVDFVSEYTTNKAKNTSNIHLLLYIPNIVALQDEKRLRLFYTSLVASCGNMLREEDMS